MKKIFGFGIALLLGIFGSLAAVGSTQAASNANTFAVSVTQLTQDTAAVAVTNQSSRTIQNAQVTTTVPQGFDNQPRNVTWEFSNLQPGESTAFRLNRVLTQTSASASGSLPSTGEHVNFWLPIVGIACISLLGLALAKPRSRKWLLSSAALLIAVTGLIYGQTVSAAIASAREYYNSSAVINGKTLNFATQIYYTYDDTVTATASSSPIITSDTLTPDTTTTDDTDLLSGTDTDSTASADSDTAASADNNNAETTAAATANEAADTPEETTPGTLSTALNGKWTGNTDSKSYAIFITNQNVQRFYIDAKAQDKDAISDLTDALKDADSASSNKVKIDSEQVTLKKDSDWSTTNTLPKSTALTYATLNTGDPAEATDTLTAIQKAYRTAAAAVAKKQDLASNEYYFDHGAGSDEDYYAKTVDGKMMVQDMGNPGAGAFKIHALDGVITYKSVNGVTGYESLDALGDASFAAQYQPIAVDGKINNKYVLGDNWKVYQIDNPTTLDNTTYGFAQSDSTLDAPEWIHVGKPMTALQQEVYQIFSAYIGE